MNGNEPVFDFLQYELSLINVSLHHVIVKELNKLKNIVRVIMFITDLDEFLSNAVKWLGHQA